MELWRGRITQRGISISGADSSEIPATTPRHFDGGISNYVNHAVQLEIKDGGRKTELHASRRL